MKHLHTRLLIAFTLFGVTPYLLIMLYFSYWEKNRIIENVKDDYALNAQHARTMINTALIALEEEISFISELEILDDMIAEDVDLQISRLLEQKSFRANEKYLELYAVDPNFKVIASSQIDKKIQKFALKKDAIEAGHYIKEDTIYFIRRLKSSFDARPLGYLVAGFEIKKLNAYLMSTQNSEFEIMRTEYCEQSDEDHYIHGKLLFSNLLEGYEIRYKILKDEVLANVYDFLVYLFLLTLIGVFIIVLMSRKITKSITKPIYELKETASKIVTTQNFHLRIKPLEIEEFDDLGRRFNVLFKSTQVLLQQVEAESENRLKKYIGLTQTFNAISNASTPQASSELALKALEDNLEHKITLVKEQKKGNYFQEIVYHNYLDAKAVSFGSFDIENMNSLSEQEIIFINSVSLMLKNHLERMSLLQHIDAASSAKSDFISAMSHELRTPLNAILGYTQYMIKYEELQEDQVDTVAKIETAGYHLLEIINDILDIAKIEAGKIELKLETMDVAQELQETIDITTALAEAKGLDFTTDLAAVENLSIKSDKKIFKQIVINLLSNAIKFTNEGYVTLKTQRLGTQLLICIEDSGIGIDKEDLDKVFDSFTQLKNAKKSESKGSGLGLSLCKQLSEAIEIELEMQSEGVEKGSCALLKINL